MQSCLRVGVALYMRAVTFRDTPSPIQEQEVLQTFEAARRVTSGFQPVSVPAQTETPLLASAELSTTRTGASGSPMIAGRAATRATTRRPPSRQPR